MRLAGKVSESVDVVAGAPGYCFKAVVFLYCALLSSSTLLGTRLCAMRMIPRSMQLFPNHFCFLK